MRLSLVIPCYNEARNLPLLVARLRQTFVREDTETILVDNGSNDGSADVLADLLHGNNNIRCVRVVKNQGYGHGILAGLEATTGEFVGWTHADMQTDPADALRGLALFDAAADSASLFVKGLRHGRPIADRAFTIGMSAFESMLLGRRLWDINAQPTLFPNTFRQSWKRPPQDFSLDLYAYHEALRQGLRVQRFPVTFGQRAHGVSHWNVDWRSKSKFIRRTVDYSMRLRRELKETP